jgi:2',3'-cyclic-nucleotide 2'-phosphodiesterase (5'-nucleotidase family)
MRLLIMAHLLCITACAEEQGCKEPDPGALVARIASPITLRKAVLRTREAIIGNLVADSVYNAFNGSPGLGETGAQPRCKHLDTQPHRCIDIAITNAGGLRSESACGERSEWREGPLFDSDVTQLLPFANAIVAIGVTGRQLYEAYEQGLSLLGQPGRFAYGGGFLHSSGAQVMVDCGAQPRVVDEDGKVRSGQVGARVVMICSRRHGDQVGQAPAWEEVRRDDDEQRIYKVGVNSFLAGGGDGFRMWVNESADGTLVAQTLVEPASPGTDQGSMHQYLGELSKGGNDEFDPIARTRLPSAEEDACVWQLDSSHAAFAALGQDPHCSLSGNHLVCHFDPSSRLTFLRRNLCYP